VPLKDLSGVSCHCWGRRALDHNGSRVNHQICSSAIVDLHNGRTAQRGDLVEALLTAAARNCVPVIFFGANSAWGTSPWNRGHFGLFERGCAKICHLSELVEMMLPSVAVYRKDVSNLHHFPFGMNTSA
jgi:hypothetical protein